jgi:hypothetical protein
MVHKKTINLIASLDKPVAHILHRVPIGAMYQEVIEARENRYGSTTLQQHSNLN